MGTEKRAILAIVVSMFIIIFMPPILGKIFPGLRQQPKSVFTAAQKTPVIQDREIEAQEVREEPIQPKYAEDKEVNFETDDYKVTFSTTGAVIKSITLKNYFLDDKSDKNKVPIVLAKVADPTEAIFFTSGLDPEIDRGLVFSAKEGSDRIIFSAKTQSGLRIEKEVIFPRDKYAIELKQTITNLSNSPRSVIYSVVGPSWITNLSKRDEMYVEIVKNINGTVSVVNKKALKKSVVWNNGCVDWVSLRNKYFSLIVKLPENFNTIYSNMLYDNELQTKIEAANFVIQPDSSVTHNFVLYAGPSDSEEISKLNLGFEESLHMGFIGSISKVLLRILKFFETITKSWGFAIILLTILINVLLFPLTFKSLRSMKQMQALQPKIEALRAANKNNPQKLNKEIFELYRKYKVNPMSGCLPMLLQMPIFFALYQALMKSIELRDTPFIWIKDLSQPDRLIPFGDSRLNLLPILMAIGMFIQQKISSAPKSTTPGASDQVAQQQKMMLIMMPVLFGFLFYGFPSGLVLYWLTNTVLTIVEQEMFLKKQMFHVEHS